MKPANALAKVLETEIVARGNLSIIDEMHPDMEEAVARCLQQATAKCPLPSIYYVTALFTLLLGRPYESIGHLAKAASCSDAPSMLNSAWQTLDRLHAAVPDTKGLEWNRLLLSAVAVVKNRTVAWASEPTESSLCAPLSPSACNPFSKQQNAIVIVAGDCGPDWKDTNSKYEQMLREAFSTFEGTIISGGTQDGISGLVGSMAEGAEGQLRAIGYLPDKTGKARADARYAQRIRTEGVDFSPLEPLLYWHDLLAAEVDPRTVHVLGVGGGDIAAAEYCIALAMGAQVAVMPNSGGAAGDLLTDTYWKASRRLLQLPEEMEAVREFLNEKRQPRGRVEGMSRA